MLGMKLLGVAVSQDNDLIKGLSMNRDSRDIDLMHLYNN